MPDLAGVATAVAGKAAIAAKYGTDTAKEYSGKSAADYANNTHVADRGDGTKVAFHTRGGGSDYSVAREARKE